MFRGAEPPDPEDVPDDCDDASNVYHYRWVYNPDTMERWQE